MNLRGNLGDGKNESAGSVPTMERLFEESRCR